jgi:hypothetical protein
VQLRVPDVMLTEDGWRETFRRSPGLTKLSANVRALAWIVCPLTEHCANLQELDVLGIDRYQSDCPPALLITLAKRCPFLSVLHITSCVTDAVLVALGAHCPRLRAFGALASRNVSDVGVIALAQGCHRLCYLSELVAPVTMQGVTALSMHCPRLRILWLGTDVAENTARRVIKRLEVRFDPPEHILR